MENTIQFNRVKHTVHSEEIAKQIKKNILNGSFQPGEKLPSERELAESFGVGRPTIREAMKTLKGRGLVKLDRTVRGYVVSTPDLDIFVKPLREQISWSIMIDEETISDFWEVIPSVLGLIAHSAVDRNVTEKCRSLQDQIIRMENSAENYSEIVMEAYKFIKDLAEITENRLVILMWGMLKDIIIKEFPPILEKTDPKGPAKAIEFHRNLLEAVLARDHTLIDQAVTNRREYFEYKRPFLKNMV